MCEVGCTAIAILDILKDGKEHANEMSMKYGTRVEHYPVNVTCEKAVHNAMIEVCKIPYWNNLPSPVGFVLLTLHRSMRNLVALMS